MIKYLKNPLLILFITLSISWCVWTTTNVFSFNSTTQQFAQYKIDNQNKHDELILSIKENFDKMDKKIDEINKKIDRNQNSTYKILMDIQKQIGDIK